MDPLVYYDYPWTDDGVSDDDDNDDATEGRVHPVVERAIQGRRRSCCLGDIMMMRRTSHRDSFCLNGDFVMNAKDAVALFSFLNESPAISKLAFVQTGFSLEYLCLFREYLTATATTKTTTTRDKYDAVPLCRVTKLIFSRVLMMEEDATLLFLSLAQNRSVRELVLHYCLTIDGNVGRGLASAVSQSPQLQILNLAGSNGSTESGLRHLRGVLRHLTELNLSGCELNCGKIAILFQGMEIGLCSLSSLDLSKNNLRAPSLKVLAKLVMSQPRCSSGADQQRQQQQHQQQPPPPQPQLHGLKSLSLSGNKRLFDGADEETNELAQALAANRGLRKLWLERCGLTAPTASILFRALETNSTLAELNIQINTGIGAIGHECMIRCIPNYRGLRSLAFDALYPQLDQSLLEALRRNASLVKLLPHYGFDKCVQEKAGKILRRNQFHHMACAVLAAAADDYEANAVVGDVAIAALDHNNKTRLWLGAICASRLLREMDPDSMEPIGTSAIFSVLRSTQWWWASSSLQKNR